MDSVETFANREPAIALPQLTPWPSSEQNCGTGDDSAAHAGFMGRRGGVSRGPYESFNLAHWIGDEPAAVAENWRRWHAANPALRPALLAQVHRAEVLRVHNGDSILEGGRPSADGLVTTEAGIALGIFSADCVPVLLYDATAHAAAALHAGWRGTLANIAAAGLKVMTSAGARGARIRAAIGPAIGPCCFEVDAELANEFGRRIPAAAAFTRSGRPGKAYLDLRNIVRRQLEIAGLNPREIRILGPCTRCHADSYFSRRAAGGAVTGLQMSFIGFDE
ncbi:MAG TPA: peptidoglycan editing factor PgeF [Candidatus Binataceae bacterium]|nr:peptidoglycan editing factor PgeF [Candidatus Binataceae bacterium]